MHAALEFMRPVSVCVTPPVCITNPSPHSSMALTPPGLWFRLDGSVCVHECIVCPSRRYKSAWACRSSCDCNMCVSSLPVVTPSSYVCTGPTTVPRVRRSPSVPLCLYAQLQACATHFREQVLVRVLQFKACASTSAQVDRTQVLLWVTPSFAQFVVFGCGLSPFHRPHLTTNSHMVCPVSETQIPFSSTFFSCRKSLPFPLLICSCFAIHSDEQVQNNYHLLCP